MKKVPLKRSTPLKKSNSLRPGNSKLKPGKIKVKAKTEEQKKEKQEQYERDVKFYTEEIWDKRPHYCEACEVYLGNEPNLCFFDHLLPKSKYPELRYEPGNIFLCCPTHHSEKESGFPHPKHLEAIIKAKELFL